MKPYEAGATTGGRTKQRIRSHSNHSSQRVLRGGQSPFNTKLNASYRQDPKIHTGQ